MLQTYPVVSPQPIAIFPAGKQSVLTLRNTGTVTVFVSDSASGLTGYPLNAGNAVTWNPETPLYAYVASAAAPSTLLVLDSGTALPSSSVQIDGGTIDANVTGSVSAVGESVSLAVLSSVTNAGMSSGTLDVSRYQTVQLAYNGYFGVPMPERVTETVTVSWFADSAGTVLLGRDTLTFGCDYSGFGNAALQVKAPYVAVFAAGITPLTLPVIERKLHVLGTQRAIQESFYSGGAWGAGASVPSVSDGTGYWNAPSLFGSVLTGTGKAWTFPTYAGEVLFTLTTTAATNTGGGLVLSWLSVPGNRRLFADTFYEPLAVFTKVYRFIAPRCPIEFYFNNQTAVTQTPIITLTMLGR